MSTEPCPAETQAAHLYTPHLVRVAEIIDETADTRTLRLEFKDPAVAASFSFKAGQFGEYSAFGWGESTFCIASPPTQTGSIECSFKAAGKVTSALREVNVGDTIGFRGPYGNAFPVDEWMGKNIVFVAGGIGLAPLRPVIYWVLRRRDAFRRVILLYGCRTPADRLYAEELQKWEDGRQIDVLVTVDNATPGWVGPVGVVTKLLQRIKVNSQRTTLLVCGPRMLNRAAAWSFLQARVPPEHIFISLERNMHCGYGRCGHCQYGPKFVCKDGPVFCFSEITNIFAHNEV